MLRGDDAIERFVGVTSIGDGVRRCSGDSCSGVICIFVIGDRVGVRNSVWMGCGFVTDDFSGVRQGGLTLSFLGVTSFLVSALRTKLSTSWKCSCITRTSYSVSSFSVSLLRFCYKIIKYTVRV